MPEFTQREAGRSSRSQYDDNPSLQLRCQGIVLPETPSVNLLFHHRSLKTAALLAVAAMTWAAPGSDVATSRMELAVMRTTYELSILQAGSPALRQHVSELAALEKRCAAARDYKGAIAARNERLNIEREIARIDKESLLLRTREQGLRSSMLPDQIILMPEQATLAGVEREPGNGALTNWSKPGASAAWKLPDLPPGGYEVLVRYSCDALEGGSMTIAEQAFSLSGTADTTFKGPAEKNIGTLKITNGSGPLTITARTVLKSNLMHLYFVKLVPANR